MAGGVDYVDGVAGPLAGDCGGLDGYSALALLDHEVGCGVAVMHVAVLVYLTGVEKYAFGGRRLARIDVGDDSDVSYLRQICAHKMDIIS